MSEQPQNPFDNDLPNQISTTIDVLGATPRIVQCIQACNEEKLIEACMLQFYDKVDKILVIEGAVQNKVDVGQATPDGHSLDRTVEIIEEIKNNPEKNPDKKITFVRIDRPWADLEEIKNTFFQYMQDGDWMLITDADEFIMPETVDQLREAISLEPWATEIVPARFYHFWRDAWHMRRPDRNWGQQHQRFIKFQQGLNYVNHPVVRDKDGVCTYFDPSYLSRRFVLKEFVVYHYSYCKDDETDIQNKKAFYSTELGQSKHGDVGAYARGGQTDEYLNHTEDLDTVLTFTGEHPPAMATHPIVQHRDEFLSMRDAAYLKQDSPPTGLILREGEVGIPDPLTHYKEVEPYSLEYVPLCWIQFDDPQSGFYKVFNMIDA